MKVPFLPLMYLWPHSLVQLDSTGMSFQSLLSHNLKCMIYYHHHSKLLLISAHELDSLKTPVDAYHYPCPYPRVPFTPFSSLLSLSFSSLSPIHFLFLLCSFYSIPRDSIHFHLVSFSFSCSPYGITCIGLII